MKKFSEKYNKYVNKLQSIGGSSSAANALPSIIMDGSKFEILEHIVDEDNRTFAKLRQTIIKTGIIYEFSIDRSFSQGGFWRLCMHVKQEYEGRVSYPIYKGNYDYTVQSLLKIELQIFINANINSIPIQKIPDFTCNDSYKKGEEKLINGYTIDDTFPIKILDDPNRKISLDPIIGEGTDEAIYNQSCGSKSSLPNVTGIDTVRDIAKGFEETKSFKVTNIEYIDEWKYVGEFKKEYLTINGKIYKYVFQNGFLLYVLYFDLDVKYYYYNNETKSRDLIERFNTENQYIPIILTTNSNSILYGLYESYVPTGMYTCKLFEYPQQLQNDEIRDIVGYGFLSHLNRPRFNYYYIGDRYFKDIYPWNKYPIDYDFSLEKEPPPARKFTITSAPGNITAIDNLGPRYSEYKFAPSPKRALPPLEEGLEDEFALEIQNKSWEPHNEQVQEEAPEEGEQLAPETKDFLKSYQQQQNKGTFNFEEAPVVGVQLAPGEKDFFKSYQQQNKGKHIFSPILTSQVKGQENQDLYGLLHGNTQEPEYVPVVRAPVRKFSTRFPGDDKFTLHSEYKRSPSPERPLPLPPPQEEGEQIPPVTQNVAEYLQQRAQKAPARIFSSKLVDYGDTPPDLLLGPNIRERKTPPQLLNYHKGLEDEFALGIQNKGVANFENTWEPHGELKLEAKNL